MLRATGQGRPARAEPPTTQPRRFIRSARRRGMFDPDGYLPVPHVVALLAILGAQGKLPRRLGFVHPGDITEPHDLSAEATARFVLGGKLAAGALTAEAVIDPSGLRLPVPARYWSSSSAAATMETGRFDLSAIGFDADLHTAHVILAIGKVAAALGFRLVPPEAPEAAAPKEATAAEAPSTSDLPASTDKPPGAREQFNFEAVKAEFIGRKIAWDRAGRVEPAPTEKAVKALLEHRYTGGWTREDVRALVKLWPAETRGRGPRKPPRRN